MNFFEVYLKSNILIQIVIFILLVLSVLSWGIIIYQTYVLYFMIRNTTIFEDKFRSGRSLNNLYQESITRRSILKGTERIFYFGFQKFSQLYHINHCSLKETLKETEDIMDISIQVELKELEICIVVLSTIASISPYFGLLGTILSIIHIFFKLGEVKYITLQTIAPGVSEALIFTAGGLCVAIPSVIAYYHLNFHINNVEKKHKIFLKEFLSILKNQIFLKKI